jgi:hypothetical protein
MSGERWAVVPGLADTRLTVSDLGNLRRDGIPVSQHVDNHGYLKINGVRADGVRRDFKVHQLVLHAFVGPPAPDQVTRHLDGDPKNNRLSNLCWGTRKENSADTARHGRLYRAQSDFTHCPQGHPYDEVNTYRKPNGHRDCRACRAEASRRSEARRRAAS